MELNKIYQGNSLELLKKLEDNSIDLVITSQNLIMDINIKLNNF